MKNLANCTPREFLKQTSKIKRSVEKWLKATDVMNIRKRMPKALPEISDSLPDDAKAEMLLKRSEMIRKQAYKNVSDILDAMLEDHPEETLEVLAYCCFVDPEKIDEYQMSYFFGSINEMLTDESVMAFLLH